MNITQIQVLNDECASITLHLESCWWLFGFGVFMGIVFWWVFYSLPRTTV